MTFPCTEIDEDQCLYRAEQHVRSDETPDRWKERSRTYEGIARAMAEQWGELNTFD